MTQTQFFQDTIAKGNLSVPVSCHEVLTREVYRVSIEGYTFVSFEDGMASFKSGPDDDKGLPTIIPNTACRQPESVRVAFSYAMQSVERVEHEISRHGYGFIDHAIKADVHSDDLIYTISFDAEPWFLTATDEEIEALAACEWGGDYPADAVALQLEDEIGSISEMMRYCRATQRRDNPVGFECHVDEQDALWWIAARRPDLFEKLA